MTHFSLDLVRLMITSRARRYTIITMAERLERCTQYNCDCPGAHTSGIPRKADLTLDPALVKEAQQPGPTWGRSPRCRQNSSSDSANSAMITKSHDMGSCQPVSPHIVTTGRYRTCERWRPTATQQRTRPVYVGEFATELLKHVPDPFSQYCWYSTTCT